MNIAYKALLAGVLAIVFTGPAIAHEAREGAWTGGLTVAVTPTGELAWSGGLAYGPVVAYAAPSYLTCQPRLTTRYRAVETALLDCAKSTECRPLLHESF